MASSQVEIVSSLPFGCVLRDRNRRDGCRESKWRTFLIKDQNLHPCMSIPPHSSASDENENSWLPNNLRLSGNNNHSSFTSSNYEESENLPSRNAQEMATTKPDRKTQEILPMPRSDGLATETPNPGAASLVQMWEKRLNRSKSGSNSNSSVAAGNENNASSCSSSSSSSPKSAESEAGESVSDAAGERERVRVADIIRRWTAAKSILPCSASGGNDNDCDHLSPVSDQTEHRIFSPRIRGRQAFTDFLMQMERERHGELNMLIERKPVSRFPHKGRIQSMLRLRLLQRGTAIQGPQRPRFTAAPPVERLPQGSSIVHLRERFSIGVEHGTSPGDATTNPRSPVWKTTNNTANLENSSIPNKPNVQIQNYDVNFREQEDRITLVQDPPGHNIKEIHKEPGLLTIVQDITTLAEDPLVHNTEDIHEESGPLTTRVKDTITSVYDHPLAHNTKDFHKEPGPSTPVQEALAHNVEDTCEEPGPSSSKTWQGTGSDYRNLDAQETDLEDRTLASQETWQETDSDYRHLDTQEIDSEDGNLASQGTANATTSCGGWDGNDVAEELKENHQEYAETSYDWINDISHPRSYWEDRRQEWYHEMLNSNSNNSEIRQLLERGTVSSFLASDFRERMDRLMATRLEIRQAQPVGGSQGGEEDKAQSKLMSLIQNHQQNETNEADIEEQVQEEAEAEEEEESLIDGQHHEASDYFDQSTSSLLQVPSQSLQRSWSFQDNEVVDNSDRATSTSPCQDFPSRSCHPNTGQCSSSRSHPSIEIELIWELRGQMAQLYQEISELRKSLKSCMDMQMMLMMQHSMKQGVHSVEGEKKSSGRALPKKGNCCICYEMKIDSLLYRCGHMCTCLKCARELQWSSGKCPICHSPIVDVVRAYLEFGFIG